jgi:hypothetical protein
MSDPRFVVFLPTTTGLRAGDQGMAATTTLPLVILCLDWGLLVVRMSAKISQETTQLVHPHIPRHPKLSECLTLPDKAAHRKSILCGPSSTILIVNFIYHTNRRQDTLAPA